eukprot:1195569-Prorocentrum_minimum.AAC.1
MHVVPHMPRARPLVVMVLELASLVSALPQTPHAARLAVPHPRHAKAVHRHVVAQPHQHLNRHVPARGHVQTLQLAIKQLPPISAAAPELIGRLYQPMIRNIPNEYFGIHLTTVGYESQRLSILSTPSVPPYICKTTGPFPRPRPVPPSVPRRALDAASSHLVGPKAGLAEAVAVGGEQRLRHGGSAGGSVHYGHVWPHLAEVLVQQLVLLPHIHTSHHFLVNN